MLGHLRTPAAIARLTDFSQHGPWHERSNAALELGLDDPRAIAALVQLIDSRQPITTITAAAYGISKAGRSAAAAIGPLTRLARTHWSKEVASGVSAALKATGGKAVEIKALPCRDPARWPDVRLSVLEPKQIDSTCTDGEYALATRVEGACILGTARGEWGGSLSADGVDFFREWHSNPQRIVELNGRHFLVQATRHDGSRGEIDELIRDANGWRVEFVSDLPGATRAMWLDAKGRLILNTDDEETESDRGCPAGRIVRFTAGATTIEILE